MVVGFGLFKIMLYFPKTQLPVLPVSSFRVVILVYLFNTTCLYDINLGGNSLLSVGFNKIFLLLFVATFVTVPHCHSVHT